MESPPWPDFEEENGEMKYTTTPVKMALPVMIQNSGWSTPLGSRGLASEEFRGAPQGRRSPSDWTSLGGEADAVESWCLCCAHGGNLGVVFDESSRMALTRAVLGRRREKGMMVVVVVD